MSLSGRFFNYSDGENDFEGYVSRQGNVPRPLVLVCHAWGGQGDFERKVADDLAGKGYAAMAVDLYGKGKRGTTAEENQALMMPLVNDRAKLQARLAASIKAGEAQDGVLKGQRAALGFCFGGLCVLDMARMGADLKGVISFHGLLGAPDNIAQPKPKAKILVLHGWQDPMAKPDDVVAFGKEMVAAGADWQLNAYGPAVHAFTNPQANDLANGMAYDAGVTRRAWAACDDFLAEVFAG